MSFDVCGILAPILFIRRERIGSGETGDIKASLDGGGFNLQQKGRFAKAAAGRGGGGGGGGHARLRSFWQQRQRRHHSPLIDSASIQQSWIDNTGKLDQDVVTDVTVTVTFGEAS